MNLKSLIVPVLAATLLAGFVRYYFPKVETKTVTKIRTIIQNNIRTVTRIIVRPDGTKETVTEIVDRSTKEKDASKVATKALQPQWRVALLTVKDFGPRKSTATLPAREMPSYGIEVQKRLVGPVFVGVQYVHPQAGISIGLEF